MANIWSPTLVMVNRRFFFFIFLRAAFHSKLIHSYIRFIQPQRCNDIILICTIKHRIYISRNYWVRIRRRWRQRIKSMFIRNWACNGSAKCTKLMWSKIIITTITVIIIIVVIVALRAAPAVTPRQLPMPRTKRRMQIMCNNWLRVPLGECVTPSTNFE